MPVATQRGEAVAGRDGNADTELSFFNKKKWFLANGQIPTRCSGAQRVTKGLNWQAAIESGAAQMPQPQCNGRRTTTGPSGGRNVFFCDDEEDDDGVYRPIREKLMKKETGALGPVRTRSG